MRRFDEYYRCYPVVMLNGPDRTSANFGGKVFLPPSALQKLTMLHIAYPMIFELYNRDKMTHAGVLEFVAEEGRIYLPYWVCKTLIPGITLTVLDDANPRCRGWRYYSSQVHRPTTRVPDQAQAAIHRIPRNLGPSRSPRKRLPRLLLSHQG
jgi:hypothetical protein